MFPKNSGVFLSFEKESVTGFQDRSRVDRKSPLHNTWVTQETLAMSGQRK